MRSAAAGLPVTTPRVVVTTSWDDGHRLDSRLADLLDRYGVAGTFYIAPRNVEFGLADLLPASGIRELAERFEIGGHTLTHQRLPKLTEAAADVEIRAGRQELEDITGSAVTSFCYPRGEYTPAQVRLVRDAGFTLARTVRRNTLVPGHPLELDTTTHAYAHRVDGPLALRLARLRPWTAAKLYREWDELAIRWFDLCLEQGGVYHLWGHSWEVDAHRAWRRLQRVLEYVSGRPEVVYVPNRDLIAVGAR